MKIPRAERTQIVDLWKDGLTQTQIAEKYSCTKQWIQQILIKHGCFGHNRTTLAELRQEKHLKKYGKLERLTIEEKNFQFLLGRIKARAVRCGIEYNLQIKHFLPLPDRCPILNLPLKYKNSIKDSTRDSWVTIDRIDPLKGYILGNVAIISYKANRIKNNATRAEVKAVLDYLDKFEKPHLTEHKEYSYNL